MAAYHISATSLTSIHQLGHLLHCSRTSMLQTSMVRTMVMQCRAAGEFEVSRTRLRVVRSSLLSSKACSLIAPPSCLKVSSGTSSKYSHGRAKQRVSAPDSSHADHARKPVIVLIGWLGAKERHFNKYIDLWQRMGHATFGYRPPTPSIVLPPIGSAKAADFIRNIQSFQHDNADRPVIYHIFSNAGFLFFGTVLRAIAAADGSQGRPNDTTSLQHSMLQPVQGLILDSAPCRLTPEISARGFTAAVLSKPAEAIEQQNPCLVSAAQLLFTPVLQFPPIANRQNQIWQAWESTAPKCPQLYLYSSADALIPPSEVQQFQKLQQDRHVAVHSKMWTDSAHCEHYRVHPEEYVKQLQHFVDVCRSNQVAPDQL